MIGPWLQSPGRIVPVRQSTAGQHWVTLVDLLVMCVVGMLCVGCPATMPYTPHETLVRDLGVAQARQRLDETLSRAINPRITEVEITDAFLRYRYQQTMTGWYGIPVGATVAENRIFFSNIDRVEVYDNHFVFIWDTNKIHVAKILFLNDEEARKFADLISSFRANTAR